MNWILIGHRSPDTQLSYMNKCQIQVVKKRIGKSYVKSRLLLILVLIQIFLISCKDKKFESTTPSYRSLTEYVYTNGYILPDNMEEIRADRSGLIEELYVSEGEEIIKDKLIVKITATNSAGTNHNVQNLLNKIKESGNSVPNFGNIAQLNSLISGKSDAGKLYALRNKTQGIVYSINKIKGDVVFPGETIAIIGSKTKTIAIQEVSEEDILKVGIGSKTVLKINAFGDSTFTGKVIKIFPQMNHDKKTFRVEIEVNLLSSKYLGMSTEANIIVKDRQKTLCVPATFIEKGDSIWVKDNNEYKKIKIKTGIRDSQFIEVLDRSITDKTMIGRQRSGSFKF